MAESISRLHIRTGRWAYCCSVARATNRPSPRYSASQPGVHLVAVADEPDIPEWVREENHALAERWGLPYVEDPESALARPDVHLVSIGSLYSRHGPLAIRRSTRASTFS